MNIRAREKLLKYFETKSSRQTVSVLNKFFQIVGEEAAPLEVSSEFGRGADGDYVRLALSCLRRDQVLELFSQTNHRQRSVEKFMLDNSEDACFGMGIADYGPHGDEQRAKLYNYYDLSHRNTSWKEHLLDLCGMTKISWQDVQGDIEYFKKVRMSAVDFYDNGKFELKVYYGPFRPRDIVSKYRHLFNAQAVKKYTKWLADENLSQLALLCVRYGPQGKSVRTDFWCQTENIVPYLKKFDEQGDAIRLYKDLCAISLNQVLTFMCIDLDQRPRSQFYFLLRDL